MDVEWVAEWIFNYPGHPRHGCSGTRIVVADNPRDAEETVRENVAQRVLAMLELHPYVEVRRLECQVY